MILAEDIASMTYSHAELANYSLQLDFIQGQLFNIQNQVNHNDAYMRTYFRQVEGSIEHLTTVMSLLYSMIKKINTTTIAERTFFEGGSGVGGEGGSGSGAGSGDGNKGKGKEDPHASRAKSVEDSSTKGEKPSQEKPQEKQGPQSQQQDESGGSGRDKGDEESGRDEGKEKQVFQSSDEYYYYQGEQDDFDAFNIQEEEQEEAEELPGVNDYVEEASFYDYKEEGEVPSDHAFSEEFKKQQQDLKRKEGELEKISQVITKKVELLKAENEEKQHLHNLKVQQRKLDVRLNLGIDGIWQGECLGFHKRVPTMTESSFNF